MISFFWTNYLIGLSVIFPLMFTAFIVKWRKYGAFGHGFWRDTGTFASAILPSLLVAASWYFLAILLILHVLLTGLGWVIDLALYGPERGKP